MKSFRVDFWCFPVLTFLILLQGCPPFILSGNRTVPNVVGQVRAAAEAALTTAGLSVGTVSESFSETIAAGTVLSQNPSAGLSVLGGTAVALDVSKGPEPRTVPDVVGKTQAEAEAALAAVGLTAGAVTESFSDTVAAGLIISQDPAAGASAARDSAVTLEISKGPEPEVVPDVAGEAQQSAETAITDSGLTLGGVSQVFSDTVAVGEVIEQIPPAGTEVAPGTPVNLVISLGPAAGQVELYSPVDVDVDSAGNVYVSDGGSNRIVKLNAELEPISAFGQYGSGAGEFDGNGGLALDAEDNLYVADGFNFRIQKFSNTGEFLMDFGQEVLYFPVDVTVASDGSVLVTDLDAGLVHRFDKEGMLLGSIGTNGELYGPISVAEDSAGDLYVTNLYASNVQQFDTAGAFVGEWGAGLFCQPDGIAFDADDVGYVADSCTSMILRFAADGTEDGAIGAFGSGDGLLAYPLGIAVDGEGNLFVADTGNRRVQKFDAEGNYVAQSRIAAPAEPDFFEPDNAPEDTFLSFLPVFDFHNFHVADDIDWVAFEVLAGQSVRILATPLDLLGNAPEIALYDVDSNLLASDEEGDGSLSYTFEADGVYYVELTPVSGEDTGLLSDYTLEINTFGPDAYEDDDTSDAPSMIGIGEYQDRNFDSADDQDWVAIEITEPVTLSLAAFPYEFAGTAITLYDSTLAELANGDDTFGQIIYTFETPGTYYLLIAPVDFYDEFTSDYALEILLSGPDAYESDNTPELASPIAVGETQQRSFHTFYDADWVAIEILEPGPLSATAFTVYIGVSMWLFDSEFNELASYSDYYYSNIVYNFESAGTYYLLLTPFDYLDEFNAGYELVLSGPEPDEFEPDDTSDAAGVIGLGDFQYHDFHTPEDADWVAFEIEEPTLLLLSAYAFGNTGTMLTLYDASLAELADGEEGYGGGILFNFETPGTYYLQIAPVDYTNAFDAVYGLEILVPDTPDAYEPDNSPEESSAIEIGELQSHNFHLAADQDWVALEIVDPVTLTMATLNLGFVTDTVLTLFDADLNVLAENDDVDETFRSEITYEFDTPGIYYLLVAPYGGFASTPDATYDLQVFEGGGVIASQSAAGAAPKTKATLRHPAPGGRNATE